MDFGTEMFLYRRLGLHDCERLQYGLPMVAKVPAAMVTIRDHVNHGTYNASQFISTCRTQAGLKRYVTRRGDSMPVVLVRINVGLLLYEPGILIHDLSNPIVLDKYIPDIPHNKRARKFATCVDEVLIEGEIPMYCIKVFRF